MTGCRATSLAHRAGVLVLLLAGGVPAAGAAENQPIRFEELLGQQCQEANDRVDEVDLDMLARDFGAGIAGARRAAMLDPRADRPNKLVALEPVPTLPDVPWKPEAPLLAMLMTVSKADTERKACVELRFMGVPAERASDGRAYKVARGQRPREIEWLPPSPIAPIEVSLRLYRAEEDLGFTLAAFARSKGAAGTSHPMRPPGNPDAFYVYPVVTYRRQDGGEFATPVPFYQEAFLWLSSSEAP